MNAVYAGPKLSGAAKLPATFGIVDLFAGPGGLGEGFTSLAGGGEANFSIGISVEKEASAHRTLRLRAFLRKYRELHGSLPDQFVDFHAGIVPEPDWSEVDIHAWRHANDEAQALELGTTTASSAIDSAIARMKANYDETIVIGGPPCQAYSLVGRARSRGTKGYVPEEDQRHYLFREYIRVLDNLRPGAFVMENVKGMLSSTVDSRLVFDMLMEDLASLGTGRTHHYELRAIRIEDGVARLHTAMRPSDFVVQAEAFGIPQRRHRVIIIGIRSDLANRASAAHMSVSGVSRSVKDVLGTLPTLRSGISNGMDDAVAWRSAVVGAARTLVDLTAEGEHHSLHSALADLAVELEGGADKVRIGRTPHAGYGRSNDELLKWIERVELRAIAQHETRTHMTSDLQRYLFCAVYGMHNGSSPKAAEFPVALSPDHRNWNSGAFKDRFRVQVADQPATTVTSHISKDGHYFIHPDPLQCRSLTVREAARLQTFPDDYLFLGNRTQQYIQVGNAVPPFLASKVANLVRSALTGGAGHNA